MQVACVTGKRQAQLVKHGTPFAGGRGVRQNCCILGVIPPDVA
jgi:hypothetical protein